MMAARRIQGYCLTALFLMLLYQESAAQNYGNEWVQSSQRYYKISTGANGIYKIEYDDLVDAGIPINTISPANLQLFHRGNEHAIHLELATPGVFQPGDYLEFYGKRNDGTLDEDLYITPEAHKNIHYNLFSDSTAYFLTWEPGASGKRMRTFSENNVLGLPPESYHQNQQTKSLVSNYSAGLHYPLGLPGAETVLSGFDHGEGWTGTRISRGQYRDVLFDQLEDIVASGPQPVLEVLIAGRNNLQHNVSIQVGPNAGNLRTIRSVDFQYHYDTLVIDTLEWTDFADGSMVCRVVVNDLGIADQVSITYAKLRYADGYNHRSSTQAFYYIPPSNSNRSYLEFQNVPLGSRLYDISDESNVEQISYNIDGTGINTVIKNDAAGRQLLLTSDIQPLLKIRPVVMRNIPIEADFIIISNKYLRKPAGSYVDPVEAYGAYRASVAGGNYDTLILNIDELYNMFSYGEKTPLAIHRFAKYIVKNGDPKYIFIIGKGLTPNYNFYRKDFNTEAIKNLVPPAGYPGSDILFTAGLKGATHEAGIPIGRIASKKPSEVVAYLNKVIEKESQPFNEVWQKELVHLSGGSDLAQQALFRRYVNSLKIIAEGEFLGAQVKSISKKGTGTTDQNTIPEDVNAGKAMITFFGHSATGTTDLDIGLVSNPSHGYNNKAKYPFMFVNGCIAGDMYNTSTNGFGEDWINTPEKGASGFLAHSGAGLTTLLKWYADLFYEVGLADSIFINKSVGEIQQETAYRYQQRHPGERNIAQVQQMALQADPSIRIFGADKPDYHISSENILEVPQGGQAINVFADFKLGIIIKNFGITQDDSLQIYISRSVENGMTLQEDTLIVRSVYFADTVYYDVLAKGIPSAGNNNFTIHIDPLNKVEELTELNNTANYSLSILGDLTKNVAPFDYEITNQREMTLVAQALDVLGERRSIRLELDTTDLFNSPARQSTTLSEQIVGKWHVNLFQNVPEQDTLTFFWRTRFDDQAVDSLKIWINSSFTYINNGEHGWTMNHFDQMKGNEKKNIVANAQEMRWEFERSETRLQLTTFGQNHPEYDRTDVRLLIGKTEYIFPPSYLCRDNTMNFVAFNKQNTTAYLALGRQSILAPESCGRAPQVISNLRNSDIESALRLEAYVDAVQDGDFVLGFSIGGVTFENWPATTWARLEEIGVEVSQMQGLATGEPVIVLGRKGATPGDALVIRADGTAADPANQQEIKLDETINGQAFLGTIASPRIGPAASWTSFHQRTMLSETPQTDQWVFSVFGIDNENRETLLVEQIQQEDLDLQVIDANIYPFVRLEMQAYDLGNLTPPQLKKWMVLYQGVPEGILTYLPEQPKEGIENEEGKSFEANFSFENVTSIPFSDSVEVQYGLFNQDLRTTHLDTIKLKPVESSENVEFNVLLESLGKVGKNDFSVFANPYIFREQDYNNNTLTFPDYLIVSGDNTNPILEVTVDGEFIMDGDIVAPAPLIQLRLKDENKILIKEDTMGVNLYLSRQCEGCDVVRINFSSPNVSWTPATADEDFKVEYQPEILEDGIYLLKAEAADASGNASGAQPYEVSFEVVNESQITNFFPYPNPFSTRTQFVFTLTGSDIPDDIIIQIMTVNGTVVREITMDEIGPIKTGHNKTQYAWDGRDEYGEQLANGVYLYQVKIFTNGKEMKHRQTSADRAFKNGFGKMYLLR